MPKSASFKPSRGGAAVPTKGSPNRSPLAGRFAIALLVVASVAVVVQATGVLDYLSFEALAENRAWLAAQVVSLGYAAPLIFLAVYAVATALSLPTGLLLSTLGGFLFGTFFGGFLNVVGATLGATAIFFAAKTVLGDALRERAGPSVQKFEAGFRENELSYMLVLRLVPVFPFWLVNLAPAFLGVRATTYVIGTFLGIVPGALVFASVGTGLGAVLASGGTPDGSVILQPEVIGPIAALVILSLLPVFTKKLRRTPATPAE